MLYSELRALKTVEKKQELIIELYNSISDSSNPYITKPFYLSYGWLIVGDEDTSHIHIEFGLRLKKNSSNHNIIELSNIVIRDKDSKVNEFEDFYPRIFDIIKTKLAQFNPIDNCDKGIDLMIKSDCSFSASYATICNQLFKANLELMSLGEDYNIGYINDVITDENQKLIIIQDLVDQLFVFNNYNKVQNFFVLCVQKNDSLTNQTNQINSISISDSSAFVIHCAYNDVNFGFARFILVQALDPKYKTYSHMTIDNKMGFRVHIPYQEDEDIIPKLSDLLRAFV